MRNEEAIAYWSTHGTVPSPEVQQATMAELTAEIAALKAQVAALQKPARKRRTSQPPTLTAVERSTTSYETKAIDAQAMETTKRLMALPELAELTREEIYGVVEAAQRGLGPAKIREGLRWGTGKYNAIIKPVVAALQVYGNDAEALPQHSNATKPATATRQRTGNGVAATQKSVSSATATRQRKVVTQ